MKNLELKNVKGSNDYGTEEQIIRNFISDTLRSVFEKYGYKPLSTPILCYYDLLALKYDDDNDILKEIYKVSDQANRSLALRYDLTVPFSKYIAMNKNLAMPYKRYEIGKVFRDGPVKAGRSREFIQCDVDSVGIEGQVIEAELISLFVEGYKKLGIDITVKYNNRKLMSGLIECAGINDDKIRDTITIVDKFEKLTEEELKSEFYKIGLSNEKIKNLMEYLKLNFGEIKDNFKNTSNENLINGIKEMSELNKYIEQLNLQEYVEFSSSLARGQDYYTGTVFEVYQENGIIKSSIGGGGRYDDIIGNFIDDGKKYPACGISFGLDVIFEILKNKSELKKNSVEVYIIPMNNNAEALKIAQILRENNVNVDIEMNNWKVKKALKHASDNGIPYVILLGEDELKKGNVVLKDMIKNLQEETAIEEILKKIKFN